MSLYWPTIQPSEPMSEPSESPLLLETKQVPVRYPEALNKLIAPLKEQYAKADATLSDVEIARRGITVALLIARHRQDGQRYQRLDKNHAHLGYVDEWVMVAQPGRLEVKPKVFSLDPETHCQLKELLTYPGYRKQDGISVSEAIRGAVYLYLQLFNHRFAGETFVSRESGYGVITSELRVPGFAARSSLETGNRSWRERMADDGPELIRRYIEPQDAIRLWSDDTKEQDRLFIIQTLFVQWYGEGKEIIDFIQSEAFALVISSTKDARESLFTDAEQVFSDSEININDIADHPNALLHMLDSGEHVGRGNITRAAIGACAYFWAYSCARTTIREPLDLRDFNQHWHDGAIQSVLTGEEGDNQHADLIQLWSLESLEARIFFWIERDARQTYQVTGQLPITPMVDLAFAFVARTHQHLEHRLNSFSRLITIDMQDHASNRRSKEVGRYDRADVTGIRELDSLLQTYDAANKYGWELARPWITQRDQAVRDLVLKIMLQDRLGKRQLDIAYCAYSYFHGYQQKIWQSANAERIHKHECVRNLITKLALLRKDEDEQHRYALSGKAVYVVMADGNYILVGNTHANLFSLSLEGPAEALGQVILSLIEAGMDSECVATHVSEQAV